MSKADRAVAWWLGSVCVVVFCMIIVGGVTRLTHSGLSMVDWKPILGVVPPLGEDGWQAAFDAYKQYPEYQKVNRDMELSEFKFIYYWHYPSEKCMIITFRNYCYHIIIKTKISFITYRCSS